MLVKISESARSADIPVKIITLIINNIRIAESDDAINKIFSELEREVSDCLSIETLSSDKVVKQIRQLFKSFGVDPTRWRPSSEAMLRRILKQKGLYRINNLVDINNYISIKYRIPIGLYDLDNVEGDVISIGIGEAEERFIGLTGREYEMLNKPVVRDASGIIGSPIVDSERTKVRKSTKNVAAIIFSHIEEPFEHNLKAALEFKEMLQDNQASNSSFNIEIEEYK